MLTSLMEQEAASTAEIITQQFSLNRLPLETLCTRLREDMPYFAMTIARGSSDHAATYAKYLLETQLGLVTASAAPSVETLYDAKLRVKQGLVIGLSQSGQSPDIAEMLVFARRRGAITVAFVNHPNSPLGEAAEYVIPLYAGQEKSVAATKSYIATLTALVQFVAIMTRENTLLQALDELPPFLSRAIKMDWSEAISELEKRPNTFVIGRGFGFPIAQEAALKFKETAAIHAEAFSSAEVLHGPFALIKKNFPLLLFGQTDISLPGVISLAKKAKSLSARTLLAVPEGSVDETDLKEAASIVLPLPGGLHPICDPIVAIQAFYMMVAKLAIARGYNPDVPSHLSKVTKTW